MHNPPTPGEFIREICLEPLGLTITKAAKHLGVSRKTLSELVNNKVKITPLMALRLAQAFGTSAESWLIQQMHYDLWIARQKEKGLHVKKLWNGSSHHHISREERN